MPGARPRPFHASRVVIRLTRAEFEAAVEEAIASLPQRFSSLLENIAIAVEDEPSAEDLELLDDEDDEGGEDDGSELLGIYRGTPRTERTHDMLPSMPDEVAIFRGPILRVSRTRREAIREIRETVIHELGHHFGLADEEMEF